MIVMKNNIPSFLQCWWPLVSSFEMLTFATLWRFLGQILRIFLLGFVIEQSKWSGNGIQMGVLSEAKWKPNRVSTYNTLKYVLNRVLKSYPCGNIIWILQILYELSLLSLAQPKIESPARFSGRCPWILALWPTTNWDYPTKYGRVHERLSFSRMACCTGGQSIWF